MITCRNDPDIQPKKKIKLHPTLRAELTSFSTINDLKTIWRKNSSVLNENLEIITSPFRVCIIKDLLDNPVLLKELKNELYDLNFNLRNMDLYEFFQSKDLQYLTSSVHVKMIYDFLKNDLMKWVSEFRTILLET